MSLIKRRHFVYGLAGLSLPVIAASCGVSTPTPPQGEASAPGAGATPATLRIGYQVIPNAELLTKALGLTTKAFPNTKVVYTSFDSGRDVNTAFAANGIDLGLAGSVPVSVGISRGLPYEVYFIHDVIGAAEALAARKEISKVADLVGKKVAAPFGSTTHFSLLALLKLENVDASKVTLLDLQPKDLVAAWQRGDIDAGYVWEPHLTKLTSGGGQVLVTSADLAKRGALTADVGLVSKDFAQKYPEALKQYVAVLDEATAFYRKDPKAAADALSKELGLSPEESLKAAEGIIWLTSSEQADGKYLGKPGQPGDFAKVLKTSADFMVGQKAIEKAADLSTFEQHLRNDVLKS